jgi:hypothetical protein
MNVRIQRHFGHSDSGSMLLFSSNSEHLQGLVIRCPKSDSNNKAPDLVIHRECMGSEWNIDLFWTSKLLIVQGRSRILAVIVLKLDGII